MRDAQKKILCRERQKLIRTIRVSSNPESQAGIRKPTPGAASGEFTKPISSSVLLRLVASRAIPLPDI
jgi:hypothetical protein